MKGQRIEKWKHEGIKEFILKTLSHQIARKQIAGVTDFKLQVTEEMIPFMLDESISRVNLDNFTFMGKKVDIH